MSHGGTVGVAEPSPRSDALDNDGLSHCPGGADGSENEFLNCICRSARLQGHRGPAPALRFRPASARYLTVKNYKNELHAALRGVKIGVGTRIKEEIIRP